MPGLRGTHLSCGGTDTARDTLPLGPVPWGSCTSPQGLLSSHRSSPCVDSLFACCTGWSETPFPELSVWAGMDQRLPSTWGSWGSHRAGHNCVWCSVRDEVCAATATAPRSHGASGPSVPAASPPVVSPACRQAAAGLWTGGNPRRRRQKMLYFSSEEEWTLVLIRWWLLEDSAVTFSSFDYAYE